MRWRCSPGSAKSSGSSDPSGDPARHRRARPRAVHCLPLRPLPRLPALAAATADGRPPRAPTETTPDNPPCNVGRNGGDGIAKAEDLLAFESTIARMPESIARAAKAIAERRNMTLRPLNMRRFRQEVGLVKARYNQAWEKNWGFVPLTDAEIDHLAKQLKPIVEPDLVCFAERQGEVIGFAVALPDFNVALKHNPSGRLYGLPKILWYARKIHRCRILLLGTVKAYRMSGVDALMYHWIWTKGATHGYHWGEGGWILEDNVPMVNGALQLGFRPYKTYRIYDKPL